MPTEFIDIDPFLPPSDDGSANGNGHDDGIRSDASGFMPATNLIINRATGLGGPYDKTEQVEITELRRLTLKERENLFEGYGIIKNIVETYPDEAPMPVWVFGQKPDGDYKSEEVKLNQYLSKLKYGSLESSFRAVSIEARLNGSAFLVLGINDGQDWDQPVDEERIESLQWLKVFYFDELVRDDVDSEYYELSYDRYYRDQGLQNEDTPREAQRIHRSRVIEFGGDLLPASMRRRDPNRTHCSSIQTAFNGFQKAIQAMGYANHLIANHVIFAYALGGLASLRNTAKGHEAIQRQATSINIARSVAGVTMYDKDNEALQMLSGGGYGGLGDLLNTVLEYMVMETRMTRFKVLGTANQKGLGSEGRGLQNRLEHATRLEAWCVKHWKEPLEYLMRLALKAKDGPTKGLEPDEYSLRFPPTLQLTPAEIAELVVKYVEAYDKAIARGILTEAEAREALFAGDIFPLNPSPVLDEAYSKQLIAAVGQRNVAEALANRTAAKGKKAAPRQPQGAAEATTEPPEASTRQQRADDGTRVLLKRPWQGYTIGIQYLPFMKRHGRPLPVAYGYIERTKGADRMAVDVYVHPRLKETDETIYRVRQVTPSGEFDEHKFMLGFTSESEARDTFLQVMPRDRFGGIDRVGTEMIADAAMNYEYPRRLDSVDDDVYQLSRLFEDEDGLRLDDSSDRLDEVYRRFNQLVNMSPSSLESWSQTDGSKQASINRMTVINRVIRLLRKPKAEWGGPDIAAANRVISFISRMRGVQQGRINQKTGYSDRDASLKNWGHNPRSSRSDMAIIDQLGYELDEGWLSDIEADAAELQRLDEWLHSDADNPKTPAPAKDRVQGSTTNAAGSASTSGGGIALSRAIIASLQGKVRQFNQTHERKATMPMLKAVWRRGAGAYSTSHRPSVGSRQQWAMGRVNAFLQLLGTGSPRKAAYTTDNDLLPADHPRSGKGRSDADDELLNDEEWGAIAGAIGRNELDQVLGDISKAAN